MKMKSHEAQEGIKALLRTELNLTGFSFCPENRSKAELKRYGPVLT